MINDINTAVKALVMAIVIYEVMVEAGYKPDVDKIIEAMKSEAKT